MSTMKLSVLYLGKISCKRLELVSCPDETAMIQSPMVALLIEHPTLGTILYDTGNSPFYNSVYGDAILSTYPITEFISIEDALAEKGLRPADIDRIILSHLHFDHAGGLRYFMGTKAFSNILVSEAELKNAYFCTATGNPGAYVRALFDLPGIRFSTIHDDTSLASDLHLFHQVAHTPGVIGLRLHLQNEGCLLTTSDTIYTEECFEKGLPPGGSINKTSDEFFKNLALIRALQEKYQASLLFGHDFEQIKRMNARDRID